MDIMEKRIEQRQIGSDEKPHVRRIERETTGGVGGRKRKLV